MLLPTLEEGDRGEVCFALVYGLLRACVAGATMRAMTRGGEIKGRGEGKVWGKG